MQEISFSAEEGFYFEPILELIMNFARFMEAYQADKDKII
jgi:hypothetical protein